VLYSVNCKVSVDGNIGTFTCITVHVCCVIDMVLLLQNCLIFWTTLKYMPPILCLTNL